MCILSTSMVLGGLVALAANCQADTVVSLGGPRKVSARIVEHEDDFEVAVEMRPVSCFDSATNLRLSREKGRGFAMHALRAHLSAGKKHGAITFRRSEVVETRMKDRRFELILRLSRDGIVYGQSSEADKPDVSSSLIGKQQPKPKMPSEVSKGDLFTVKDDYLSTIETLEAVYLSDIPAIPTEESQQPLFFEQVADFEEHVVTGFRQIQSEFEADKLLLRTETEELQNVATESEKTVISTLSQQVQKCITRFSDERK